MRVGDANKRQIRESFHKCTSYIVNVQYLFNSFFLSNHYFTPDVTGKPLTNRNISYIKVFGICPSPKVTGGDRTHKLWITRHDSYRCGHEMR